MLPVLVKSSHSLLGLHGVRSRLRALGYSSHLRNMYLPLQECQFIHPLVLSSVYRKLRLLCRVVQKAGSGKGSNGVRSWGTWVLILPFPIESSCQELWWCMGDAQCGFASAVEMPASLPRSLSGWTAARRSCWQTAHQIARWASLIDVKISLRWVLLIFHTQKSLCGPEPRTKACQQLLFSITTFVLDLFPAE